MKIIKYILLELKAKKEGSLYAMRDTTKADDLILLLNYIFFEYTRNDLELITQNLEIIDEEKDDEVILHGNARSLILDLINFTTIYICSFSDYQKFEAMSQVVIDDCSFVELLQHNKFESFKIDRRDFLQVLRDWHKILDMRPQIVLLYQNKEGLIAIASFASRDEADKFLVDNKK